MSLPKKGVYDKGACLCIRKIQGIKNELFNIHFICRIWQPMTFIYSLI